MDEMTVTETVKMAMRTRGGMILDALRHPTNALDYLRMLRN